MTMPFIEDTPLFSEDILEGNYVTWTYRRTFALPNGILGWSNIAMFIDDLRHLLYVLWDDAGGWARFGIWNLNTGVNVFLSGAGVNYHAGWSGGGAGQPASNYSGTGQASTRQRYIAFTRADTVTVEVWKDGALQWTDLITNYPPCVVVDIMHMSRSGKWFIMTNLANLVMFEGQ